MSQQEKRQRREQPYHPYVPSSSNPYDDAEPIRVKRSRHPHYSVPEAAQGPRNAQPNAQPKGEQYPATSRPSASQEAQPRHAKRRLTAEEQEAERRANQQRSYHETSATDAYAPVAKRSAARTERQYAAQQRRIQKHPDRKEKPRPIPGNDYFRTPEEVFETPRKEEPPLIKRTSHAPQIIAGVIVAMVVVLGVFLWTHRSVPVTVDGTQINVVVNSTLKQVIDASGEKVDPGNLVSVSGDTITVGDGHAFSATIDGNDVPDDQLATTTVKGGEHIKFGNGNDRTEDYDVLDTETIQPKLKMEGTQGSIYYVKQWGKTGTQETRKGKTSGQTAEVAAVEAQDLIIQRQGIAPQDDEKLVALTFDDGPSQYTEQYLDILDQYGIKATFNMIGSQLDEYPEAAKRVADDGMQIASHTWDHKQLTKLTEEEVQNELDPTFQKIKDVTGYDTTTIRQPYGSMNANVWLYSKGSMSVAVFWTHDSQDWERPGVDKIVSNSTGTMYTGAIILMHDGGGNRDQDLEALPQIIEAWQNAGYKFVTISDLMASDPRIPEEVVSGDEKMPDDAVWPTEIADDSVSNDIP